MRGEGWGATRVAIDDGGLAAVELGRAAEKVVDEQGGPPLGGSGKTCRGVILTEA